MDQTPERITYSVKEAAAALGVSEWMVREEIRIGRIDSVRFGARILIPRQALERLVGNSDRPTTNPAPRLRKLTNRVPTELRPNVVRSVLPTGSSTGFAFSPRAKNQTVGRLPDPTVLAGVVLSELCAARGAGGRIWGKPTLPGQLSRWKSADHTTSPLTSR